jgi:hypothetical protein
MAMEPEAKRVKSMEAAAFQAPTFFQTLLELVSKYDACVFGSCAVWSWFDQPSTWMPRDLDVALACSSVKEFFDMADEIVAKVDDIQFNYQVKVTRWNSRVKIEVMARDRRYEQITCLDLVYAYDGHETFLANMNTSFNRMGWHLGRQTWLGTAPTPIDDIATLVYVPILEDAGAFVNKYTARGWTRWRLEPAGEERELFLTSTYVPDAERKWRYFKAIKRYENESYLQGT